MTHVHCHVTFHSNRVSFRWSHDNQHFEPYLLTDSQWDRFVAAADNAKNHLRHSVASRSADLGGLATTGHELYQSLCPDTSTAASEVADWLNALEGDVVLEVVTNQPARVPWTVVYHRTPPHSWGDDPNAAHGFWGIRYALSAGASVHPFRKVPTLRSPDVLFVIDPVARDGLESFERNRLSDFLESREWTVADSAESLSIEIANVSPEIIYFWGRADQDGIHLGSSHVPWTNLKANLARAGAGVEPVIFANWYSDNADVDPLAAMLDAISPRPNLLAGCEANTNPSESFAFGLDVLEHWFNEDATLGETMHHIRTRQPSLGIAYGLYGPPNAQASWEEGDDDETEYELPAQPYRPLMPYEHTDRPLFTERDADVMQLCSLLDDHRTSGVVLHGDIGVGKKSLIRAGAYPLLEDDCIGYRFLFATDGEEEDEERETSLLAIRATNDLASQMANVLVEFCDTPYTYTTPNGRKVTVNLAAVLAQCLNAAQTAVQTEDTRLQDKTDGDDEPDAEYALWRKLRGDTGFLTRLLTALDEALPYQLILLIENTEEVFYKSSSDNARHDLRMLTQAAGSDCGAKIIISLRSDYLPQLWEQAPDVNRSPWGMTQLRLPTRTNLLRTILLPTSKEPILHGHENPFDKYGFQFEEDAPESLLDMVYEAAEDPYVSLLPILQIACSLLYFAVKDREDKVIRQSDLHTLGDMEKLVEQYVDSAINQIGMERLERRFVPNLIRELSARDTGGRAKRRFKDYDQMADGTWQKLDIFPTIVEKLSDPDVGLLDKETQYYDGGEREVLSLGQDVLAQLGSQYEEQDKRKKFAGSRLWESMWIIIPVAFLLMVLTYMATRRWFMPAPTGISKKEIEAQMNEARMDLAKQVQNFLDQFRERAYFSNIAEAYRAYQSGSMLRFRQLLLRQLPDPEKKDFRSFEWWHLWSLADADLHTLTGHKGQITVVAVAPNENWTASGSEDGAIKLWDLRTGKILADFLDIEGPILDVAFSENGKWLAASGVDKNVHLWNLDGIDDGYQKIAKPAKSLVGPKEPVLDLAFLNNDTLAGADFDGALLIWDISKEKPTKTLAEQKEPFTALAVAPSGKQIITGDRKGNVRIHPIDGGKSRTVNYPGSISTVAVSPDGKLLAVGGAESQSGLPIGTVHVFDFSTGKHSGTSLQFTSRVSSIRFEDNAKLLVAGRDDIVVRWNSTTAKKEVVAQGHFGRVRSMAVANKKGWLVTGSADRTVKIWDLNNAKPKSLEHQRGRPLEQVAFFPDSKLLASTGVDNSVKIWDIDSGKQLTVIEKLPGKIHATAVSPVEGKHQIAIAFEDKNKKDMIAVWEVSRDEKQQWSVKQLTSQEGHAGRTTRMVWSPDGQSLASAGTDNLVVLWDIATKKRRLIGKARPAPVVGLSFSDDGAQLATVDAARRLLLWDSKSGSKLPVMTIIGENKAAPLPHFPTQHTAAIRDVVFMPQSTAVVTAGDDRSVRVHRWKFALTSRDGNNRERVLIVDSSRPMRGHTDAVNSLARHPTKNLVVSGSADGTVRLWDADLLAQRFVFTGSETPIQTVAISPDRLTIAAGNADGVIHLWRSAPRDLGVEHK